MENPKSIYEKLLQAEKNSTKQEIVDREKSKQIRVHMPCEVIRVNGAKVDVEIKGKEDSGFGYFVSFPLLIDIPILYNNYTSKAYIITPIQEHDTGVVEFLDFNSSSFTNDGKSSLTTDQYPHSLNNGIFINGFIPDNKQIDIPINKPIVIGLKNGTYTYSVGDSGEVNATSMNSININSQIGINLDTPDVNCTGLLGCEYGANGTFQAGSKTVTVCNGIITSIE